MTEHKVDPGSIHVDQRKTDSRRDAWDRDYLGWNYVKPEPKTDKRIENAKPVFIFALFYVAILVMMSSME